MTRPNRKPVSSLIRFSALISSLLFCSAAICARAQSDSGEVQPKAVEFEIPSLKDVLAPYFLVGAAIRPADLAGAHSELLKKHFNSITAENAMKWASLESAQGQLNFASADALVNFAAANNMHVRGHTLVWHEQVPVWLFKDDHGVDLQPTPENKALLLRRLEKHVREVVSHFKDRVYAWDVVNEVLDPHESDGFRRSPWFQITGTDYIDTAFRVAHEVAPHAKLYINDYDTTDPRKRAFLLNLVRNLRNRGVPVDGVGHQMHVNIATPSPQAILETINMFSELGVDNQITELDMSLYSDPKSLTLQSPEDLLIRQGYRYRDFFHVFRELKGKISSVTLWGMADDHTWLSNHPIPRRDLPLLFDEYLHAKPAYWGIADPAKLPKEPTAKSVPAVRSIKISYGRHSAA
jgi:endo-1,4-beta-xylanase